MAGLKYTFEWQNEKLNIVLPVRIEKSYSRDFGFKSTLICPDCYEQGNIVKVKQYYTCENGHKHTIGEIKYRLDESEGVVYDEKQKKAFLEQNVNKKITIHEPVDIKDVFMNIEFFDDYMEIYSDNDNANNVIAKIHKSLAGAGRGLLATIGYRGKEKGAIIIPTWNKLILVMLRDYRLIKEPKGEIQPMDNPLIEKLKALSEDKTADLYMQFIEKIKAGEQIEIVEQKVSDDIIVNGDLEEALSVVI